MRKWRIEDSRELYNIKGWGADYFDINDQGNVVVIPRRGGPQIDLKELLDELETRDVSTPVLLRFPDILADRLEKISSCFKAAAAEYHYTAQAYSVYPIKVNQMSQVVDELMKHGKDYKIGLEAGSKPELHAVLAYADDPDDLIICNGYKDEDFIELALLGQKMGKKIYIVVEKLNELKTVKELAEHINIRPNIGIRIKLASSGSGKWEDSGGDKSKFGLNASELLEAVEYARQHDLLDCIKLIHFHLGSQITKIRMIKTALREASQFYVQLRNEGCQIDFFDIGGGLGIDYDGTSSTSASSINYSIQEYANDAIATLVEVCEKNDLSHPNIITESGRSITAHHSVLVFDVLETTSLPLLDEDEELIGDEHELVQELYRIWENLSPNKMLEYWHDAQQIREEALDLFSLGMLDLKTRALTERYFWTIAREVQKIVDNMKHPPDEVRQLTRLLSDKYFCNFSLFQSLPDSWAIDQIFPILPIHRHNEKPGRLATIQDITCDSDGKIENFIGARTASHNINLHDFKEEQTYYIGVFLIGAYQEILGDLHNLFGDTNAVHVTITDSGYEINQVIDGETVAEVLAYVEYNPKKLVRTMETWVTSSVKAGKLTAKEGKEFLSNYRSGLYGYTYLGQKNDA